MYKTYKYYEFLYKREQAKHKTRLESLNNIQLKEEFKRFQNNLKTDDVIISKNMFSNFSFIELVCIMIFFKRFEKDLNYAKTIIDMERPTALNVISGLYGYRDFIDILMEDSVHRYFK